MQNFSDEEFKQKFEAFIGAVDRFGGAAFTDMWRMSIRGWELHTVVRNYLHDSRYASTLLSDLVSLYRNQEKVVIPIYINTGADLEFVFEFHQPFYDALSKIDGVSFTFSPMRKKTSWKIQGTGNSRIPDNVIFICPDHLRLDGIPMFKQMILSSTVSAGFMNIDLQKCVMPESYNPKAVFISVCTNVDLSQMAGTNTNTITVAYTTDATFPKSWKGLPSRLDELTCFLVDNGIGLTDCSIFNSLYKFIRYCDVLQLVIEPVANSSATNFAPLSLLSIPCGSIFITSNRNVDLELACSCLLRYSDKIMNAATSSKLSAVMDCQEELIELGLDEYARI